MSVRARPSTVPRRPPRPDRGRAVFARRAEPDVAESWRVQPWAIRVLRAFLGVTFVYAGVQKLADPNFFHAGSFDYIGSQLQHFGEGSPIGWLIRLAGHAPVLTGLAIAVLELAVGMGTLLGIAPVTAAAVGLGVNLVLFLSATWHVHPYFLGSDSVYAVAWAAYLVALVDARRKAAHEPVAGHRRRSVQASAADLRRREFLRGGVLAAGTLFIAGISKALAGQPSPAARASSGALAPGTSTPTTPSPGAPSPGSNAAKPNGKVIASLASIPVGGAIGFTAPAGFPAVLLRPSQSSVLAYSRVCTHAGCLVQYDQRDNLLICPCHGAEYDISQNAKPIAGPAFSPLQKVPVAIDGDSVVVTS